MATRMVVTASLDPNTGVYGNRPLRQVFLAGFARSRLFAPAELASVERGSLPNITWDLHLATIALVRMEPIPLRPVIRINAPQCVCIGTSNGQSWGGSLVFRPSSCFAARKSEVTHIRRGSPGLDQSLWRIWSSELCISDFPAPDLFPVHGKCQDRHRHVDHLPFFSP